MSIVRVINLENPDFSSPPRGGGAPLRLRCSNTPPAISVVTPFFETGEVFLETVNSVLAQTFQQFEWIVVDDCSRDPQSSGILRRVEERDPRIKVFVSDANRGPSAARNLGIHHASAEFIYFIDSDDLIDPTALEKYFWFLLSFPNCPFVSSFQVGFGAREYLFAHGFHDRDAFRLQNMTDSMVMFRRSELLRSGLFDEENRSGLEDWEFWLRCASKGIWGATIPEYLEWYRWKDQGGARWANWDGGENQANFMLAMVERYPALYTDDFPSADLTQGKPVVPDVNELAVSDSTLLVANKSTSDNWREALRFHRASHLSIVSLDHPPAEILEQINARTIDFFIASNFLPENSLLPFLNYLKQSRDIKVVDAVGASAKELVSSLVNG